MPALIITMRISVGSRELLWPTFLGLSSAISSSLPFGSTLSFVRCPSCTRSFVAMNLRLHFSNRRLSLTWISCEIRVGNQQQSVNCVRSPLQSKHEKYILRDNLHLLEKFESGAASLLFPSLAELDMFSPILLHAFPMRLVILPMACFVSK